jgi:hypothetical protein
MGRATKSQDATRDSEGAGEADGTLTDLSLGQGAVDTGSSLGGVSSEEGVLVDDEDIVAVLEDGVCSTKTGETTSDDDDLVGHDVTRICVCDRGKKKDRS